ncbi:pseudouridine synthase [Sporormia fimetaria CBS 119925]|uniref:Pseudouridine synthase n=1 Tax=Sporormia fimetaria CBS 119925 TaxID=1340428 RepID=A0A6A6V1J9_9PLEO|nr:pseudouridine synthase [Sporormia fimetaria CBS 119925]
MADRTRPLPTRYDNWSHNDLVARIQELENQVAQQSAPSSWSLQSLVASVTGQTPPQPPPISSTPEPEPTRKPAKPKAKPFDASKYSTRLIALKFAYLGQKYNGFEHHRNNSTPLPTVEEELWKALVKTRLISPVATTKEGETDYGRVGKKEFETWEREGADVNWEGCEYSKCGRTDRGVSAFGQVIGVRVRSNRPLERRSEADETGKEGGGEEAVEKKKTFDDLKDELPYIQLLNRVLPPDIRIYAWCPNPPADFSARFSCKERRYKYFFTNPCFAPVPGSEGLYTSPFSTTSSDPSSQAKSREGHLSIPAMHTACTYLTGLHDFRNFCKIDASKQLTNFQRRIFHASIDEVSPLSVPAFLSHPALSNPASPEETPKMYCFTLHGSAFLWHQVRSIVAILFLIGQKLESPELVKELLNIERNPTRPKYEMASDAPLVLWDCIFPDPEEVQSTEDRTHGYTDRLNWVYVGDPGGLEPKSRNSAGVGKGKWGRGGVVDDVWEVWRRAKVDETLAGLLLDVVSEKGRTLDEVGKEEGEGKKGAGKEVQPRLFDGADAGRAKGKYVPVMLRERQESVEVVNERYAKRKGLKMEERRAKEEDADE